jgi:hypothetical protein
MMIQTFMSLILAYKGETHISLLSASVVFGR